MATGRLTPAAFAFRVAHGAIAAAFLGAIGYVWWCALTELVLTPTAARRAIPVLGLVAAAGLLLLARRPPGGRPG